MTSKKEMEVMEEDEMGEQPSHILLAFIQYFAVQIML